jgi:Soluble lytic murein transglycosylase and related regulatory proteins (some contain LysM/invasin domains)
LDKTYTSAEINDFIDRFAGQYGVDPNVLRRVATCESGFNPMATNGTYAGLYQFSASTWASYRNQIGENSSADLRYDAEESVQTAAYVISVGKGFIWPNCMPGL